MSEFMHRILVVEDDVDTRAVISDILELSGYAVSSVGTAKEALAHRHLSEFEAIILDRRLPDGDADELLPLIRDLAPDASVIVATGDADLNGAITAFREGVTDYILKPINPDQLRASLKRLSQLRDAEQRAQQFERLADVGQAVSGVAHECRNVMQRIQSHAELLRLDLDDRPAALKHINKILEANECLRMILNELRDYSGPIVLTKENVEITTPIQRAWDSLFTVPARQGATLHVVCGESCGALCDVDPMRMEQVFRNLFENSIAASDPPPNIEVNLCETIMGEQDMLQVSIRDNGPGFSELQRQHAFEPFFTTKKAGTGLGLPISKRIIEAHRGDIAIATTTAGAHITVTLPRSVCPAESVPSGELEPSL